MDAQQENYPRINSLTSIRAFCTFLVVAHHLNLMRYSNEPAVEFIDKYILHTSKGVVSFFFILSGFVISYSSMNWKGWQSFLIKRLSRVFPNHWIVSLTIASFTFCIPLLQGEDFFLYFSKAMLNLALMQSFVPDRLFNFAFNGVTWTLSVELFFYLSFLFIRRLPTRAIFVLFLSLFTMKFMLETAWVVFDIQRYAHWLFFVFPIFRLPEFLLGVWICRLYLMGPEAFSRFRIHPLSMLAITIGIIGACRYAFSSDAVFLFSTIPTICAFLLLLSCLSRSNSEKSCLNSRIFLFLGEASFSIYLIHQPILNGARRLIPKLGIALDINVMLLVMIFSFLASIGYFLAIEKKAYRKFIKILQTAGDSKGLSHQ